MKHLVHPDYTPIEPSVGDIGHVPMACVPVLCDKALYPKYMFFPRELGHHPTRTPPGHSR